MGKHAHAINKTSNRRETHCGARGASTPASRTAHTERKLTMKRVNQAKVLREIYQRLWAGCRYYERGSGGVQFYPALELEEGTCGWCIFWTHFGRSANRASQKELKWIIETIFQMKPSEFADRYEPYKDGKRA